MDRPNLYDRQPTESARAYAAARAYFELGPGRSLVQVVQKYAKSSPSRLCLLKRWSAQHDWVDRAAAWDNAQLALATAARERQAAALAQEWRAREDELRERRYQLAVRMLDRAERMLDWPLAQIEHNGENGEHVTIQPANWNFMTACRMAVAAVRLAQEACHANDKTDELTEIGRIEYVFENVEFRSGGAG